MQYSTFTAVFETSGERLTVHGVLDLPFADAIIKVTDLLSEKYRLQDCIEFTVKGHK